MDKTLYVGNLAPQVSEDRLRELFTAEGREVESVALTTYRKTGKSRGFGFVKMTTDEGAAAAILALQGTELEGREIKVGEATREKRTARADTSDDYGGNSGRFGSRGGGNKRGRR